MIRVVYAGSPSASASVLEILLDRADSCGFSVVGVLSNPPSAKGRRREPVPTPVSLAASSAAIPVITPEHLDSACRDEVSALSPDILVSFAYGRIFGPKFLVLFPMGGINLHPSALPEYRGCTPVTAAILNRNTSTAVTVQKIALGIDEGNILAQENIPLDGTETGGSLLEFCAGRGAELVCRVLSGAAASGKLPEGAAQSGIPSYTGMITKNDARIDWDAPAAVTEAAVRAYNPEPMCWTLENGVPLRIISASCLDAGAAAGYDDAPCGKVLGVCAGHGIMVRTGDGILAVGRLQRQGKKEMDFRDFMNGARGFVGTLLE